MLPPPFPPEENRNAGVGESVPAMAVTVPNTPPIAPPPGLPPPFPFPPPVFPLPPLAPTEVLLTTTPGEVAVMCVGRAGIEVGVLSDSVVGKMKEMVGCGTAVRVGAMVTVGTNGVSVKDGTAVRVGATVSVGGIKVSVGSVVGVSVGN